MNIAVEQIPQTGHLEVNIQLSANFNYSAEVSRRLVGRFVADEIGYLLRADMPTLVLAEKICWRVPIILALPHTGPIGTVGTIDVDVETGQRLITPNQILQITTHAETLATHYSTPAHSTL